MHAPQSELPRRTAAIVAELRARAPRVHCITNAVAQAFTANMLLAAGAVPSMTIASDEVAAFTASAGALLVNLGTFDSERRQAAETAIAAATEKKIPWVLDPVFIDRSPGRAEFAKRLVARKPTAMRLNAAEFRALTGQAPESDALMRFARETGIVVGRTGETDRVTDGVRFAAIENGDPLMGRVTAMGCAASALAAACLAVENDALVATAAALLAFGVAGEIAAASASGPGTFAAAMLDALHNLTSKDILARARVT